MAAVQHIVHDYAVLVSAGMEVTKSHRAPLNHHVQYSFLVQCRNFGEFFSRKPARRKNDIQARNFIGRKTTFKFKEWSKWATHMDKHLFHLTYDRVKNTRLWKGGNDNSVLLAEFQAAWRTFHASPQLSSRVKAEFHKEITKKLSEPAFADLDLR